MLLHAMDFDKMLHFKKEAGCVVVQSPDTDVMVLLVHCMSQMKAIREVWLETGTVTRTLDLCRMIPINNIATSIGPDVCSVLPAVHALTGCDSVSHFSGVGKKTELQLVRKTSSTDRTCIQTLSGDDEDAALNASRPYVAALYDPKSKCTGMHSPLNKLRHHLAATRSASMAKLPPCEVSFVQHGKRASWTTYHLAKSDIPI
jgi:hypothetical protein